MEFLVLTKTGGILGPFATLLGFIMNYIYMFLEMIGIPNIGLTIIVFTLIVNILLMPLTVRSQKFQKVSAVMNPEMQKIQAKYKGKTDQASAARMQAEMKALQNKYGTSQFAGCLVMLIQMPILFALYRVIWNVPAYISSIYDLYLQVAEPISRAADGAVIFEQFIEEMSLRVTSFEFANVSKIIDALYVLKSDGWEALSSVFSGSPEVVAAIAEVEPQVIRINSFLGGLNVADTPTANGMWPGILIPVLSGLTQFASTKIAQAGMSTSSSSSDDNPMAGSMKMMNYMFPIMSVFICFSMSAALGIYWIASAVFRTLATVVVNKYLDTKDIDDIIAQNREKAAKKAAKKGDKPSKFEEYAQMNTKRLEETEKKRKSISEIANTSAVEKEKKEYKPKDYTPVDKDKVEGKSSIAGYANMLKKKD